jgi:hypothetical protein
MSVFHLGLDEVDMTVMSTDTSGDCRVITRIQQPAGERHATEAIWAFGASFLRLISVHHPKPSTTAISQAKPRLARAV